MNPAYYDQMWKENAWGRKGQEHNPEAFWDGRAEHFSTTAYQDNGSRRVEQVLDLLIRKGMIDGSSSVLDIGCGPGRFAAEIAKVAKEVIGIDVSSRMLDYAEKLRLAEGLDNLRFIKLDWEHISLEALDWEKRFDLVFASMCPAVKSQQALNKMITASRGYCYTSNFAYRKESVFDGLRAELFPEHNVVRHGEGIYCCFNLLWLDGFYPEITYMDSQWEHEFFYADALQHYAAALPIPGGLSPEQSQAMEKYLKQYADDGIIREKVDAKFASIYWKI